MVTILPYLSSVMMSIIACVAVICGSMMSWKTYAAQEQPAQGSSPGPAHNTNATISLAGAVLMPITASVMLFSLFMFFSNVQLILLGYFLVVCLTTCSEFECLSRCFSTRSRNHDYSLCIPAAGSKLLGQYTCIVFFNPVHTSMLLCPPPNDRLAVYRAQLLPLPRLAAHWFLGREQRHWLRP